MSLIRHSVRVCFGLSGHSQDRLFYLLHSRIRVHTRARAFSIAGFDDLTDREIRQREMVLSAKITESKHARLGRRHLDVSGHICVTKYTCTLHSYTATFFLLIITFVITNDIPENDFSKSTLDFNDCLSFASPWLISFAP